MPRPSLGSVQVKILVDKPRKTYYGWDDPVSGTVSLLWQPAASVQAAQELFGPLQLDLRLEGYQQSDLYFSEDSPGESPMIRCLEERKLCFETTELHSGSIKMLPQQALEFPFAACFPGSVSASSGDAPRVGARHKTPRGNCTTRYAGNLLPPTMKISAGFGSAGGTAEILYFLSCQACMDGIDVGFTTKQDTKQVLKYGGVLETGPDPGMSNLWPETYTISNKSLLPESERPSIFSFSKKKAFPTFCFSLVINSVPKQIVLGEALKFSLHVILHPIDTTATFVPLINLERCKVMLIRNTVLENEGTRRHTGGPRLDGDAASQLDIPRLPEELTRGSPNRDNRYVHQCRTKTIVGIIPSLYTEDIKVSYTLKFEVRASLGKDTVKLDSKHDIEILGTRPLPTFEASVSDRKTPTANVAQDQDEQLPAYSKDELQQIDAEQGGDVDSHAHVKSLDPVDWREATLAGPSRRDEDTADSDAQASRTSNETAEAKSKAKG